MQQQIRRYRRRGVPLAGQPIRATTMKPSHAAALALVNRCWRQRPKVVVQRLPITWFQIIPGDVIQSDRKLRLWAALSPWSS
jgi:hypothetical protein